MKDRVGSQKEDKGFVTKESSDWVFIDDRMVQVLTVNSNLKTRFGNGAFQAIASSKTKILSDK